MLVAQYHSGKSAHFWIASMPLPFQIQSLDFVAGFFRVRIWRHPNLHVRDHPSHLDPLHDCFHFSCRPDYDPVSRILPVKLHQSLKIRSMRPEVCDHFFIAGRKSQQCLPIVTQAVVRYCERYDHSDSQQPSDEKSQSKDHESQR